MESLLDPRTTLETSVLTEGENYKCKRVFKDGVITLKNNGQENAGTVINWSNSTDGTDEDHQFTLELAPGSTIEFEIPSNGSSVGFLDCVCVDLICGGPLEISYLIPSATLN